MFTLNEHWTYHWLVAALTNGPIKHGMRLEQPVTSKPWTLWFYDNQYKPRDFVIIYNHITQNPLKATSCWAYQAIPYLSRNLQLRCGVYMSATLGPILSDLNEVHTSNIPLISYPFQYYLPFKHGLPSGLTPIWYFYELAYVFLIPLCTVTSLVTILIVKR